MGEYLRKQIHERNTDLQALADVSLVSIKYLLWIIIAHLHNKHDVTENIAITYAH